MSEQAVRVARILGWELSSGTFRGKPIWRTNDGSQYVWGADRPYDADDLLAWLREQGFDVFSGSDRTHLDRAQLLGGLTKVTLKPFKRHVMCFTAPTLLAALEAAVLDVAEGRS
jgi:hypothetical protein